MTAVAGSSEPGRADDPAEAFRRRAAAAGLRLEGTLVHGPFALSLDSYELTVDGEVRELSPLQLELLAMFFAAPNHVWSRSELNHLTGGDRDSHRIDVRLTRLRASLGADIFRSVPGRGWALRPVDHLTRH